MNHDYDCIVVGGGIAGLLTALRLTLSGLRVIVLERDRLGSGATISNHGIIHSGALYAVSQPQLSSQCREALSAYRGMFPRARIATTSSWYFADAERLDLFERRWREQGLVYDEVDRDVAADVLIRDAIGDLRCVAVADLVVSSRRIMLDLAQRCLDAGVAIATSTPVVEVRAGRRGRPAVRVGLSEWLSAERVVLCGGLGIVRLIRDLESSLAGRFRSRLAVMAVLPNVRLDRALFCLQDPGPTAVPAGGGVALASLVGGWQPTVDDVSSRLVPLELMGHVLRQLRRCVRPDVVDAANAWGYVCTKTELGEIRDARWQGGPNYAVVDHGTCDGLKDLWSLVPGKMTVALHASRELLARMLGTVCELALPPWDGHVSERAERLVAAPPWQRESAVTG